MTRLSKTTKLLSILLNIICWVGLLGGLLYGTATAIGCFNSLSSEATGSAFVSGIALGNLEFYSGTGGISVDTGALRNMQFVSLIVYFVQVPLTAYGIQLLRKVLRPIVESRPFTGTGHLLKQLGWVCLLISAVQNLADWFILSIMEHQYHFANFFLGSIITDVYFQFELDFTFIVAAVVVFILSGVFCYGEELQQLSDETV